MCDIYLTFFSFSWEKWVLLRSVYSIAGNLHYYKMIFYMVFLKLRNIYGRHLYFFLDRQIYDQVAGFCFGLNTNLASFKYFYINQHFKPLCNSLYLSLISQGNCCLSQQKQIHGMSLWYSNELLIILLYSLYS